MTRQVFFEIKEKDVAIHEPFLFMRAAQEWAEDYVRAKGESGSAHWSPEETVSKATLITHRRTLVIDEV